MALQTKLFFLLQVCVIIFIVNVTESVERCKHGCIICGKKSQRSPFRCVKLTWKPVLVSSRKHRETFVKHAEKLSSSTETMGRHFTTLVFSSRLISLILLTLVM